MIGTRTPGLKDSAQRERLRVALAALVLLATSCAPYAQTTSFLAISDVHYEVGATPDNWYCHSCDTSKELWDAAQSAAAAVMKKQKPAFVVYLGDLPGHGSFERSKEMGKVLDGLEGLVAGTGTRLIYLPGNNDSVDSSKQAVKTNGDYCEFTYQNETPFDQSSHPADWPVVNGDSDIIDRSGVALGFYSVYPLGRPASGAKAPALRLIALNTVIFTGGKDRYGDITAYSYEGCMGDAVQQKHSDAQIKFLIDALAAAKLAGDKVILAMHVPPGVDGYGGGKMWEPTLDFQYSGMNAKYKKYAGQWVQKAFLNLVDAHQADIVGVLTGHTHLNGIRRLQGCKGDFVELGVSVPGVTTDHGNNPAFKLFSMDAGFELIDNTTYYAKQPAKSTDAIEFDQTLAFNDNYPCTSCTGTETLYQRIKKITDADLTQDMQHWLQLRPDHKHGAHHYKRSIDVTCSGT